MKPLAAKLVRLLSLTALVGRALAYGARRQHVRRGGRRHMEASTRAFGLGVVVAGLTGCDHPMGSRVRLHPEPNASMDRAADHLGVRDSRDYGAARLVIARLVEQWEGPARPAAMEREVRAAAAELAKLGVDESSRVDVAELTRLARELEKKRESTTP